MASSKQILRNGTVYLPDLSTLENYQSCAESITDALQKSVNKLKHLDCQSPKAKIILKQMDEDLATLKEGLKNPLRGRWIETILRAGRMGNGLHSRLEDQTMTLFYVRRHNFASNPVSHPLTTWHVCDRIWKGYEFQFNFQSIAELEDIITSDEIYYQKHILKVDQFYQARVRTMDFRSTLQEDYRYYQFVSIGTSEIQPLYRVE